MVDRGQQQRHTLHKLQKAFGSFLTCSLGAFLEYLDTQSSKYPARRSPFGLHYALTTLIVQVYKLYLVILNLHCLSTKILLGTLSYQQLSQENYKDAE